MSKRAEDYANKRFPPDMGEDYIPIRGGFEIKESDFNSDRRFGCKIGYEQAEKDTIERAVAWLKDYVKYFEIYDEKGIEEFKKAMEEEK